MRKQNDLPAVFERLKKIFAPYAKKMVVAHDNPDMYLVNTRHIMRNRQPLCFGGVRLGKNYVSYYLMSVYTARETMSPELRKRMQGKCCFNFKQIDERLFKELAKLTKAGAKRFSDERFIDGLRKAQETAALKANC